MEEYPATKNSTLQQVRNSAAKRNMDFQTYLRYSEKPNNDLTPEEQWKAEIVKAAFKG